MDQWGLYSPWSFKEIVGEHNVWKNRVLCTSNFITGVTILLRVTKVNQNRHIMKEIFCFTFREIFCSGLFSAKKWPLQWDKDCPCISVLVFFLEKVTVICTFMYDYPDWGFSRAFSSVVRQMPGWIPQRRGTARTVSNFFVALCIFCFVLCICFVTFPVFVCICGLNNCHRVFTQLQLNISYHISVKYRPILLEA
jgi:hypothetical protein